MAKVLIVGIDISNHQGKAGLDLDALLTKHPEIGVVIIKSSDGINYDDAYDEKYIEIALAHGCIVGVYHYARPDKNGWLAEAKFFLSLTLKYKGKVFYVLDWEIRSAAHKIEWPEKFLDYVAEQTGSTPIFYSYESLINSANYSGITKYPLWVAKYRDYVIDKNFDMSGAGSAPNVKWWDSYIGWQWTSVGRLDGYSGNLDCTAFYIDKETLIKCIGGTVEEKKTEEKKVDPVDLMIEIMSAEVGYKEGANNHTKYGDEMHALQPRNMDAFAPWCDCWFDWCVLQLCKRYGKGADTARAVLCGDFDDYTYASVNLYKKAGRWTQTPKKGYQIFFGGSGHTGGVEYVEGNTVHTIEGNKSDMVKRCSYNVNNSNIIGYGMPKYELLSGDVVEVPESVGVLRRGSQGDGVRFLQLCLGGLDDDGSYGWKTMNAVINFQRNHGLVRDGEAGPQTFEALRKTLPLVQFGDQGRFVKALQVALGGLEPDGSYGPLTKEAVLNYQREKGIEADSLVGYVTWGKLIEDVV